MPDDVSTVKNSPWVLLGSAIIAGLASGGGTGFAFSGDKFTATDAAHMEARLNARLSELTTTVALLTQQLDFESKTRQSTDDGRSVQVEQLRNRITILEGKVND